MCGEKRKSFRIPQRRRQSDISNDDNLFWGWRNPKLESAVSISTQQALSKYLTWASWPNHSDKRTFAPSPLQMLPGQRAVSLRWCLVRPHSYHLWLMELPPPPSSFNPDRLSFWRDDWRSVGALIPWSGSRCHSKGTRPVWSTVERLSGHGTLWFPGQGGNRHYCPKVPLLLLSDNMGAGLAAIEQAREQTIDMHAVTGLITV